MSALGIKHGVGWTVDDVSGAALKPEVVKKATAEELQFVRKMCFYIKVPRWMALGNIRIRTRWIVVNKGDGATSRHSLTIGPEGFADKVNPR